MKNRISQLCTGRFLRTVLFAAVSAVVLAMGGCSSCSNNGSTTTIVEAFLDTQATQVGGATTAVTYYTDGTVEWTLYSMANRLAATRIGITKGSVTEITAPGYIQHITVVSYNSQSYALLSMGGKGIGVVDISNPAAMVYRAP